MMILEMIMNLMWKKAETEWRQYCLWDDETDDGNHAGDDHDNHGDKMILMVGMTMQMQVLKEKRWRWWFDEDYAIGLATEWVLRIEF